MGSNSLRLFLVEGVGPDGPEGERFTTVVGLRKGADDAGTLAGDAIRRLDEALADYASRVSAFRPQAVVAVGTSAVRDAPNASLVADAVRERLGVSLRVVAGNEEAALAFAGARLGAAAPGDCVVVDIGGGSTELVRGGPSGIQSVVSLQIGAVRQTEAFLAGDPPTPGEIASLRADVVTVVRAAPPVTGPIVPLVGVAGTITTLAAIELEGYDPAYVHGHRLSVASVERILALLAGMPRRERERIPGLEPARAPVIVAGAAILAEVLAAFGATDLTVSERDLLDGIALAALDPGSELGIVTRP